MTLLNPWTLLVWMALWAILIQALGRRLPAWARTALAVGGMTGAAILAVALRLSADSAPAALPWPASLGRGPALAADAEMFPFAAILILTLAGAMLADVGAWDRWPRAGLLAAAALFSVYAENLLALAMAWILLEVLTWGRSGADEADEASIGAWSAFWGSVGLAAILWVWHETQGASLRPYEVAAWTPRARMLLVGVALIRMGVFPLVSRRLSQGAHGDSPLDAAALAPTVAGVALAQRAAFVGPLPQPQAVLWVGALGTLACGMAAWLHAEPRQRVAWALGAPLGILLMMWAEGVEPAPLPFAAIAASVGLGVGLWTIRWQTPQHWASPLQRAVGIVLGLAPVAVACAGPLSPAMASVLGLWQSLLNQSGFVLLVFALAGQMFAMAALWHPGVAPSPARGKPRMGVFAAWGLMALALALGPRWALRLGGHTSAWNGVALSPGAWAALVLPLLGATTLPELGNLGDAWREYGPSAGRILGLGWLRRGLAALGNRLALALRGLEALLCGDDYVLWALVLLLGLVLMLGIL